MRLTKNQLKELIKKSIDELDFKSQDAFDAYNKKHKMRKTTKVNIAGKDTTAGDAKKKGTDKGEEQTFNVFVNGHDKPMKIKAKDEKSARHQAYQQIQNPNVKVTAEPAGVGGPSHANVPKDGDNNWMKTQSKSEWSKQKQFQNKVKKNNNTAKDLGFFDSEDITMNGSSGEVEDYMTQIPDEGQDFDKAEEYIDYIRDNEMGERNDDADVVDDYRIAVYKILHRF